MPSQQRRAVAGRKAVYFPYILDEIQKIVQFVQLPTPRPAQQPPPHCTTTGFYILCTFAKKNNKKSMFLCTAHAGKLLCLSHVGSLPHFED